MTSVDRSAFGAARNLADDVEISRALAAATGSVNVTQQHRRFAERDLDLTRHRWPAGRSFDGPYVPGDAIRARGLAAKTVLHRVRPAVGNEPEPDVIQLSRAAQLLTVLHDAVAYFVPGPIASAMITHPLDDDWLDQLRTRHALTYVALGSPFELTDDWYGGLGFLYTNIERLDVLLPEALAGRPTPPTQTPAFVRASTIALQRHQRIQLLGFVVAASEYGTLRDLILTIVRTWRPDGSELISLNEGRLSTALITPLVHQLLTVVAWGQWQDPATSTLPTDPRSKAFRRAMRDPAIRAREPDGRLGEVRVLAAPKQRPAPDQRVDHGGTHASPTAHLRRAHPQRYRVGTRDDWTYDIRYKPEQLINAGDAYANPPTVYRLPKPPPPK